MSYENNRFLSGGRSHSRKCATLCTLAASAQCLAVQCGKVDSILYSDFVMNARAPTQRSCIDVHDPMVQERR